VNIGGLSKLPTDVADFVSQSDAWLNEQVKAHPTDDYWQQVGLWRAQITGIAKGFAAACQGAECQVQPYHIFNVNVGATIGTVAAKFNVLNNDPDYHPSLLNKDDGKCTGFVKLVGDKYSELYVGQDTWTSFNSMTRVRVIARVLCVCPQLTA